MNYEIIKTNQKHYKIIKTIRNSYETIEIIKTQHQMIKTINIGLGGRTIYIYTPLYLSRSGPAGGAV